MLLSPTVYQIPIPLLNLSRSQVTWFPLNTKVLRTATKSLGFGISIKKTQAIQGFVYRRDEPIVCFHHRVQRKRTRDKLLIRNNQSKHHEIVSVSQAVVTEKRPLLKECKQCYERFFFSLNLRTLWQVTYLGGHTFEWRCWKLRRSRKTAWEENNSLMDPISEDSLLRIIASSVR